MACSKLLNCLTPPPCPLPPHPPHPAPSVKGSTLSFRYSVICASVLGINDHESQTSFGDIILEFYCCCTIRKRQFSRLEEDVCGVTLHLPNRPGLHLQNSLKYVCNFYIAPFLEASSKALYIKPFCVFVTMGPYGSKMFKVLLLPQVSSDLSQSL